MQGLTFKAQSSGSKAHLVEQQGLKITIQIASHLMTLGFPVPTAHVSFQSKRPASCQASLGDRPL